LTIGPFRIDDDDPLAMNIQLPGEGDGQDAYREEADQLYWPSLVVESSLAPGQAALPELSQVSEALTLSGPGRSFAILRGSDEPASQQRKGSAQDDTADMVSRWQDQAQRTEIQIKGVRNVRQRMIVTGHKEQAATVR
jgi:hypothetical protein